MYHKQSFLSFLYTKGAVARRRNFLAAAHSFVLFEANCFSIGSGLHICFASLLAFAFFTYAKMRVWITLLLKNIYFFSSTQLSG